MGKYLMKPILKEQEVLIDTPNGFLRVAAEMNDRTGEGSLVFAEAYKYMEPGDDTPCDEERIPLARIRITTKERALVIARIMLGLAAKMNEFENGGCADCETCENQEFCREKDEEDESNG